MTTTRRLGLSLVLSTPALLRAGRATAQPALWPQRPVRLLIPFAPGGAADTLARIMAQAMAPLLGGQQLVVENRPGAGGTIAAAHVAQAAPDGHTLLLADIGANAVAGAMFEQLPYDPVRAFAPVLHLVNLPMVMIARTDAPFGDPAGFLAAARARPGTLTYSSAGPGGASHLAMELLNRAAGVTTVHVPYRGGSQVVAAVISKEVDVSIGTVASALGFIRSGAVKAVGVGTLGLTPLLPTVPPIASEVPGFSVQTWHGVLAPAGTPAPIVAAANAVFNAALALPELRARLETAQGAEVIGGPPKAFGAFIAAEIAKWTPVVREARIRPE
jgi:tripartite-type tricarboxylate transporter receptor subunit TctC